MAHGTATEIDVQIGGIIRDRRAALGLTQAELGKAIGVTFQQVQKYERGVNRVAAATLLKVADALQCNVCEPLRVSRRLFGLSYAAMGTWSIAA